MNNIWINKKHYKTIDFSILIDRFLKWWIFFQECVHYVVRCLRTHQTTVIHKLQRIFQFFQVEFLFNHLSLLLLKIYTPVMCKVGSGLLKWRGKWVKRSKFLPRKTRIQHQRKRSWKLVHRLLRSKLWI